MTKVVRLQEATGPEGLRIVKEEVRAPGPGEVRVRIKMLGLNRAEALFLRGMYLVPPKLPSLVGAEAAGTIESVGPGVTQFKPGDEVCVTPNIDFSAFGYAAELAIAPVEAIVPRPAGISDEEAAALWMAYPTAWGGLIEWGGLKRNSGQWVVVSAASSSVGFAAIQIAKSYGARVIATTRTSAKKAEIAAHNPDAIIATQEENFVERVMELTGGAGFDVAFDPVAGPFLAELADAAAPEATLVEYGVLAMADTPFPMFPAIGKGFAVKGFHVVFHLFQHQDRIARATKEILAGVESGQLKPVLDKVFTLDEIADAYRHMESNVQTGKVLVRVP